MTRQVKKPLERRAEIIEAARYLFQTKEYEKASMQDIMDTLQIAKGTIYHYFKSKEELLEAVIYEIAEESLQALKKEAKKDVPPLIKMKNLILAGRVKEKNSEIVDALHMPKNGYMHTRLLAVLLLKQAPIYAEVIKQGCRDAVFSTAAPLESAEFIIGGVQFLIDSGIYPWSKEDLMRRARHLPKLIEQQLNAPAGSFDFLSEMLTAKD